MAQLATVEAIDPDDEQSVTLRVGALRVVCFANNPPASLAVGRSYPVAFTVLGLDDPEVKQAPDEAALPSLTHEGVAYAYNVTGRLSGEMIDAGMLIEAPWPPGEYAYLDGKMITLTIDRLDVEFLDPIAA